MMTFTRTSYFNGSHVMPADAKNVSLPSFHHNKVRHDDKQRATRSGRTTHSKVTQ